MNDEVKPDHVVDSPRRRVNETVEETDLGVETELTLSHIVLLPPVIVLPPSVFNADEAFKAGAAGAEKAVKRFLIIDEPLTDTPLVTLTDDSAWRLRMYPPMPASAFVLPRERSKEERQQTQRQFDSLFTGEEP